VTADQPLALHQVTLSVVEVGVEEIVLEWRCDTQVVTCTARYGNNKLRFSAAIVVDH